MKKKCEVCDKEYNVRGKRQLTSKYCSRECNKKSWEGYTDQLQDRKCLNCNKEFKCYPYMVKRDWGKFCSTSCWSIYTQKAHFVEPKVRFWNKVNKTNDCWVFGNGKRYGRIWINGKNIPAHRFSYELKYGSIPENLFVLHKCDNPPCVNPEHLFLGTSSDNTHDMVQKDRHSHGEKHSIAITPNRPRGENNHNCRFSDKDIVIMRDMYEKYNLSQRQIARAFNTGQPQIQAVVNYKTRKTVVNL